MPLRSLRGRRRRSEKWPQRGQFLPDLQLHKRRYGAKKRRKMDHCGHFAADAPSAAQTPGAAPPTQPEVHATSGSTPYGFNAHLGKTDAVERVSAALKDEGFGLLTGIYVPAAMKNKLGIDVPAHRILGACNPQLAHRALAAEPDIGLLLPCNVFVRQDADGNVTGGFIDPMPMLQLTDDPEVEKVARNAHERLQRARAALAGG